jgi:hypothetical protein
MTLLPLISAALIAFSLQVAQPAAPAAIEVTQPTAAPAVLFAVPAFTQTGHCAAQAAPMAYQQPFQCPNSFYCRYQFNYTTNCCVPSYIAPGAFCPYVCG